MALKTQTTEIDGVVWQVKLFNTSEGIRLFNELVILLGPVLSELMAEGYDESSETSIDMALISNAILRLVHNMGNCDVVKLIKALLANTKKNDQSVDFDTEFSGNYSVLVKLLVFICHVNYADLLSMKDVNKLLAICNA